MFEGWNSAPNLVTYARIALVVAFIVLLAMAGPQPSADMPSLGGALTPGVADAGRLGLRWAAAGVFLVAACTDKLDGWLARRTNAVTELGKLMDPIADKLLMLSALIVLSVFGEVAWWVTALFLVREIGITVMRLAVIDGGGKVIAAAWPGKLKTLFQSISLTMLLAPFLALGASAAQPDLLPAEYVRVYYVLAYAMLYVALALCVYSGVEYAVRAWTARGDRAAAER
nr:CDP-diacylglycerol--glycerol-3-phosphate 3-phosphatidyltransferase [Bifidobacterium sp. DSM 109958]